MDDIIKKFFELRDKYWESEDIPTFIFLKHILVYFYESRNELSEYSLYIPGKYDLVKSDKVLFELGYRKYSIDYLPKYTVYECETTKVTFRNTL